MYLLDTNCLYLLSDIDSNLNINISKFKDFLSNNQIAITVVNIFEILNNPHHQHFFSFIIQKAESICGSVSFLNANYYNEYFDQSVLFDLENKSFQTQQEAKKEIGKVIADIYSFYYSNLLSSGVMSYFIILSNFSDCLEKGDDFFQEIIQKNFDYLESKLYSFLLYQFKKQIDFNSFNEKSRKSLIENLFISLVNVYRNVFNKTICDLHNKGCINFEILSNRLTSITRRIDIYNCYVSCPNITFDQINLYLFLSKTLTDSDKERMEEYLIKMVKTLSKKDDRISDYMNHLFEEYLKCLIFEKARFKDNDICDSLVLDFYKKEVAIDGFISFDKKFTNKAKEACPDLIFITEEDFKNY